MEGEVVSVIPTFQPPPETLELVRILAQSGPVVVSDDASPCTSDHKLALIHEIPSVSVIRNTRNRGIGRALNHGLALAHRINCPWLLTVDQDSTVDREYALHMVEYADQLISRGLPIGALGAGLVQDLSGPLKYPCTSLGGGQSGVTITPEVVQSGTLWSVPAMVELNGFSETLGMDAVDAAACLGLRSKGLLVAINPTAGIWHQIEGAQQFSIAGRRFMVTGHSPTRRRAIVRNRVRLFPREFVQSPLHAVRTVRRSVVNYMASPISRRT